MGILSGNPNFDLPEVVDGNYLIDTILGFEDMDLTNQDKTVPFFIYRPFLKTIKQKIHNDIYKSYF
jgi:hypothetical protein